MLRNLIYLIIILPCISFYSCTNQEKIILRGQAQGTTYQISYYDNENRSFQQAIDSILNKVDQSMSTYLEGSTISKWNRNETIEIDSLFRNVFQTSVQVYKESDGFFDPTVGPLIELYGFGKTKNLNINTVKVDSILQFIGLDKVELEQTTLKKEDARIALNFNAIAQGYTVDLIRDYFLKEGIHSFMVEVGGELYCNGKKANGEQWIIALDKPEKERKNGFQEYIGLENEAVATSGNYRKVIRNEHTGEEYVHTINPKSGEARMSSLLSVTIIHKDCILADAYATAVLSMGLERGIKFLNDTPSIKAYLIYDKEGELISKTVNNFKNNIIDLK